MILITIAGAIGPAIFPPPVQIKIWRKLLWGETNNANNSINLNSISKPRILQLDSYVFYPS